jgi:hypothetical protein
MSTTGTYPSEYKLFYNLNIKNMSEKFNFEAET